MAACKQYKVLKDFPSRNGATQYKAGRVIQLNTNTRTKALVEMGYIKEAVLDAGNEKVTAIAMYTAIKGIIPQTKRVDVHFHYKTKDVETYYVEIREKE